MKKSAVKDNFLTKLSSFFFTRWRFTLIAWLIICLGAFGIYSQVIQREGFPTIEFPISIVSGRYFVDDVERVDREITEPILGILGNSELIKETQATSTDNSFSIFISFNDNVDAKEGTQQIEALIQQSNVLPTDLNPRYLVISPAKFLNEFEILLSVYSREGASTETLQMVAQTIAEQLGSDKELTNVKAQILLETAFNPQSKETETRQIAFNKLGVSEDGKLSFYPALTIGLSRSEASKMDVIELSEYVQQLISDLDLSQFDGQFEVEITADFADTINRQLDSLESNLTTGLLAVMFISLILISWRASIITALFMTSVMLISILILYLFGISLNVVSLFSLILALGLFVDDATIIVEAIEVSRHRIKSASGVIKESISRVGMASLAGTLTTVLVFVPLLFTTGILGEFLRVLPITIIIALLTSLVLSLILIPLFSRFLLLKNRKISWLTRVNPVAKAEVRASKFLGNQIRLLKAKKNLCNRYWAVLMVTLSLVMVGISFAFAQRLSFDIFPDSKDSDEMLIQVNFPNDFSLTQAEATIDTVNRLITESIGDQINQVIYISSNERRADAFIELVSHTERLETSPQLVQQLQASLADNLSPGVETIISQQGPGGPADDFPFNLQIFENDREKALALAEDIYQYLNQATIQRSNGSTFEVSRVRLPDISTRTRIDGRLAYIVSADFEATDTSAVLQATEGYVKEHFNEAYLTQAGYEANTLGFDFGQESDNKDSFSSLKLVFVIALISMFILLALQFRSWLQPLLILLAIPFSFLGVTVGLYYTNNSVSFFTIVGLIGLIGIAVNNTILLTDYANQERRRGKSVIEAVAVATEERFRPLIATSLTTVVALLPLAFSDPFWEALSYTIIFGLLSSTLLVVLAFPYYYLIAEWLHQKIIDIIKQKLSSN